MRPSRFFSDLRKAYAAEIDDLTFDSDGRDVLRQRLSAKRKEMAFLRQMIEISPEMVAVVFHQGFQFKRPSVMTHLVAQEPEDFPAWESLSDVIQMRPWTQDLVREVLQEPMGEWFLTVAAGLEFLHGKADAAPAGRHADADDEPEDDDDQHDHRDTDDRDDEDGDDDDRQAREDAGADWMVEQGFDRKD